MRVIIVMWLLWQTENFAKKSSSTKGLPVVAEAEDALVSCLLQSADGWRSRRTMGGKANLFVYRVSFFVFLCILCFFEYFLLFEFGSWLSGKTRL